MKKVKCWVLLTMVVVLLMGCLPANGETCYVALKALMKDKSSEDWYLGTSISIGSEESKDIYAVYMEKDEMFYIRGMNANNEGEMTVWENVKMLDGYRMIYNLCSIWQALQENMDKGYSILIAITNMDMVEGDWIIDDQESANSFMQVMEKTFASLTGN